MKTTLEFAGRVAAVMGLLFLCLLILSWVIWQLPGMENAEAPDGLLVEREENFGGNIDTPLHRTGEWGPERPRRFNESPTLRGQVEAGLLPRVEERLPENPLVVYPIEQHGPYGGTWNRFATGINDIPIAFDRIAYDGLVRWDPTGTRVLPNLASSWEISEEGKVFTFHLRRGVRWSDGEPFTVGDIVFWYEYILQYRPLTPAIPSYYQHAGETMELEAIDDYTFEIRFARPNGLFLERLASGHSLPMVAYARHYIQNYHPEFVPEEELVAEARARNFHSWQQLFQNRNQWRNTEKPTLSAWVLTRPPPASPVRYERNPYYWKVDVRGNQLPYIDEIGFRIINADIINLRLLGGGSEMQNRHIDFANYPLLVEKAGENGFQVREWPRGGGGVIALAPNLNHRDPVMAGLIGDSQFRKALSLAIDRDAISQISYHGLGTPRQIAPPPTSLFYDSEYAKAYTDFDLERANRLLDEIGLTERDDRGIRLRPDGRPLYLQIEHTRLVTDQAAFQIIAEGWRSIGIGVRVREQAREIFVSRIRGRQHDVTVWGSENEQNPLMSPDWFLPIFRSHQAPSYGLWFHTGGQQGTKPNGDILRCMELYWEIEETVDEGRRVELFREILDLNRRNLWIIGAVGELPALFVVSDRMRNVPERAMTGWIFRTPGNTAPETYALEPVRDEGQGARVEENGESKL